MAERKLFLEVTPAELAEFEEFLKLKKEKQTKKKNGDNTPTKEDILNFVSKIPSNNKYKEAKIEEDKPMIIENGCWKLDNENFIFDYRLIIKEK